MQEIWKDIPGYEGKYQVSSLGNIKSLNYNHTGKEKILNKGNEKYLKVTLRLNGIPKTYRIHRLVAEAFLPYTGLNPDGTVIRGEICVNHKDENTHNNSINNLEWCDYVYNNNYGNRLKKAAESLKYDKSSSAKKIRCIETNEIFSCALLAAEKYLLEKSTVSHAANPNHKQKTAGRLSDGTKLHWEYLS